MENECWMCGRTDKPVNRHHVLNKSWHPKHNGTIPLCRECHSFVHKMINKGLDFVTIPISKKYIYNKYYNEKIINHKLSKEIRKIKMKPFNGSHWVRFK